jgi:hypothetical protein
MLNRQLPANQILNKYQEVLMINLLSWGAMVYGRNMYKIVNL